MIGVEIERLSNDVVEVTLREFDGESQISQRVIRFAGTNIGFSFDGNCAHRWERIGEQDGFTFNRCQLCNETSVLRK